MNMDGFRPVTAGSNYILTGCEWFRVVVDDSGVLQMISGCNGWFQMVSCDLLF